MEKFEEILNEYAVMINDGLVRFLPPKEESYGVVIEAMEYSLLSGGKRLRGALLLEIYRLYGGKPEVALPFACALEMIHAYSLIHDDLPCMDDDDLRRGKPTCHKVYGEAIAVLAGDALLNRAFEIMCTAPRIPHRTVLLAMSILSSNTGASGMIGGQVMDMALEGEEKPLPSFHETMVERKTGALFETACAVGCILAGCDTAKAAKAAALGWMWGVMFQISDDMLDVIGTEETFGKPIGSDEQQGKCTYVTLYGLDQCRSMLEENANEAKRYLEFFPPSPLLSDLTRWIIERQN